MDRANQNPGAKRIIIRPDGPYVVQGDIPLVTKTQVVSAMEQASPWSTFTIDNVRFVDVGDDVTALVYTADAARDGRDGRYRAAISSVYVNRGGRWRLVLHQQTPL